jgi:3-hydroxyisobutyrate dehydrogenase-like beta-hydroxyacid dehydrogenase
MVPVVGIIAPGSMGSGVAARLVGRGVTVLTSLAGRSAATVARAEAAGMQPANDMALAAVDMVLSIVPPAEALPLAERLAPVLRQASRKTLYVDCNAVSPKTVARIAEVIAGTGCAFVDAGIIGGPPRADGYGPTFYAAGIAAQRFATLGGFGLDVQVLDGPVGAASALKMSYAGITKGLTALGSVMLLAATRAGAAEALHRELGRSQPALLAWLTRQVPGMYPKAYRWVAEMEEIADFVGEDAAARRIFEGAAKLYDRLAADATGAGGEVSALSAFVGDKR